MKTKKSRKTKNKRLEVRRKFKKAPSTTGGMEPSEEVRGLIPGTHDGFHKDNKKTVVLVDGIIYDLVPSDLTVSEIKKLPFSKAPHVRYLNYLIVRDEKEQKKRNHDSEVFDKYYKQMGKKGQSKDEVTSLEKARKLGVDPEEEVRRLLKLKKSTKSPKEIKKINKRLRKLEYKKYLKPKSEKKSSQEEIPSDNVVEMKRLLKLKDEAKDETERRKIRKMIRKLKGARR